ncbi:MAG: methyltransferase [Pseudomonadota bacterium]
MKVRLIADPRFQRLCERLPLVRRRARSEAEALFGITSGFVRSQILFAALDLGLLRALRAAPATTPTLAADLALKPGAADRLLRACEGLKLIRRDEAGCWALDVAGAVVANNPGIEAMVMHHAMLYRDLADPVRLLRAGQDEAPTEIAGFWAYAGKTGDAAVGQLPARAYSDLMALSQDLITREVLAGYGFGKHRVVADLGGGDGSFLRAVADRFDHVRLILVDLPAVAALAQERFDASGLALRAEALGGDFFRTPPPAEADCVTLIRVLCDHDDGAVRTLLTNLRRGAKPGTTLVIAEPMAGSSPGASAAAAYFSFYFQAMGAGRCRHPQEICTLLTEAGFERPKLRSAAMPLFAQIITARVPSRG